MSEFVQYIPCNYEYTKEQMDLVLKDYTEDEIVKLYLANKNELDDLLATYGINAVNHAIYVGIACKRSKYHN